MTIYTSQMISSQINQQLGMFANQAGYAQQIGFPGMMPPPMMPQLGMASAARVGGGGIYGEQMAARMGQVGATGLGVMGAGLGVASAFSPIPLDPFSGAMMGARMGLGGMAGGAAMGAVAGLPLFAATTAAQVYGGAFTGGMQDQAALNSTLRNNFNFMGGQGTMGRGFSQNQMGQIGQMVSGEVRRNPFTSAQEMNGLIAGGADSGMFTAVRDVQQFTQRFRQMMNTLRDVQRELGGTLTEALQFVRGAQQAGIFQNSHQANFAAEVRASEAVTGMDRQQLIALSAQGAQISRAHGGLGRQGAMGALRGAQQLGAAISSGAINQELLSEATGGLTGGEAVSAFTTNMLNRAGRYSRTGAGRFGLFALSNGDGTGLDQDMMQRFMAGDLTTGEVSRRAHSRAHGMGRARALNQEGHLRGAIMEQGGLAGQVGMMRLMVGDRVMDQSDDLASLVLQRRFRMSRPESEMMMSLMRNQGAIAEQTTIDRQSSARQQAVAQDVAQNRSLEGFMTHLEHGLQDAAGVTKVRELGRSFLTRISGLAQRAMDDFLGVAGSSLTQGDQRALGRMSMGRISSDDIDRLTTHSAASGNTGGTGEMFGRRSAAQQILHGLHLSHDRTNAEIMEARGIRGFSEMDQTSARVEMQRAQDARRGSVIGDDREQLERLEGNVDQTTRRIQMASLMARGAGDEGNIYQFMGRGTSANAVDAFMSRQGMRGLGIGVDQNALLAAGGGSQMSLGMIGRDLGRAAVGLIGGSALGPLGALAGLGIAATQSETLAAVQDPTEARYAAIASGGEAAAEARRFAGHVSARDATEILRSGAPESRLRGDRRLTDQARAALIAEGMGTVKTEDVRAVMESDTTRSRLSRMSGMTNRDDLMSELSAFRRESMNIEDNDQRTAAESIALQMERNIRRDGNIGTNFRRGASEEDRRRDSELMNRYSEMASGFRGVAERLGDVGGSGGEMAEILRRASNRITSFHDDTSREDLEGYSSDMGEFRRRMSGMDTSSEEYRQMAAALGESEAGQGLLGGIAQERQQRRALEGRGRRGRHQAIETAFGMVTGNSLSSMTFELSGGRTIQGSDRNAAQRLAQLMGGDEGTSIMQQLQTQLTASGVGREEAGQLVQSLAAGINSGGRGVGNIDELIQRTGDSTSLQRIQAQQVENRQRQQDPLGVQRNDLLTQIRDGVRNINRGGGDDGVPPGIAR
jgi:hypothetical protein